MFGGIDESKKLLKLGMAAVSVVLLCIALGFVLEENVTAAGVAGLLFCAAALALLFTAYMKLGRETFELKSLEKNFSEVCYIKFDFKERKAFLNGDIPLLTGIDVGGRVFTEEEYGSFIEEVISSKYEYEKDIYMSKVPGKWIKMTVFELTGCEITIIQDVSQYVSKLNLVRSLRFSDPMTGVLNKESFTHKLRQLAESNSDKMGIIQIVITGLEKVTSFSDNMSADNAVIRIATFIKKYENPHNTFLGRTSTNEFVLAISDTYDTGLKKTAEKVLAGISETVSAFPESVRGYIKVYCGYALFGKGETSVGSMLSAAEFAAFDAERIKSSKPVQYDGTVYENSANEFRIIQVFNEIVEKNLIDYHFQPIVSARNGDVYGYESLMRPQLLNGIKLTPVEMLTIAENQDMLGLIEKRTFFNSLKILSENEDFFLGKKIFINSISSSTLSDVEFDTFHKNYGEYFDRLVIEITEVQKSSDNLLELLNQRFKKRKVLIALDDYGTGFSNETALLHVNPDFIKIGRSLLSDIDTDPQKQHLVSNLIDFARIHGIKTLAKGIETTDELEAVINLGIDLVQGFITSKASPIYTLHISEEVRNLIVNFNLRRKGQAKKVYEIFEDPAAEINIVDLSLQGYTDISISANKVILTGDKNRRVNMRIMCEEGTEPTLHLRDVNLNGACAPVLTLGRNCAVMLVIEGENTFSSEGIRVPGGSKFLLSGDGDLNVTCTNNNGVAIGGNYLQEIGRMAFNGKGKVIVRSEGDNSVAIGGGIGGKGSSIKLISGIFDLKVQSENCVGIGIFGGETKISMHDAEIIGDFQGQNVIGFGGRNAKVSIENNAKLNVTGKATNCCIIGTLDKGIGKIEVNGGRCDILMQAKKCVGIGTIGGITDISLNEGSFFITAHGTHARCVGGFDGTGNIEIKNIILNAETYSSEPASIDIDGTITVYSGNIQTNSTLPIEAVSPFGSPLTRYRIKGGAEKITVDDNGNSYVYAVRTDEVFENTYVYLPVGFESDDTEVSEIVC